LKSYKWWLMGFGIFALLFSIFISYFKKNWYVAGTTIIIIILVMVGFFIAKFLGKNKEKSEEKEDEPIKKINKEQALKLAEDYINNEEDDYPLEPRHHIRRIGMPGSKLSNILIYKAKGTYFNKLYVYAINLDDSSRYSTEAFDSDKFSEEIEKTINQMVNYLANEPSQLVQETTTKASTGIMNEKLLNIVEKKYAVEQEKKKEEEVKKEEKAEV